MDDDHRMNPVDSGIRDEKGSTAKRAAVSGPARQQLDIARENEQYLKALVTEAKHERRAAIHESDQLRAALIHTEAMIAARDVEAQRLQEEVAKTRERLAQMERDEMQLQGQFFADQEQLGKLFDQMHLAQKQIAESTDHAYQLQRRILRAQLKTASRKVAPTPKKKKGRLSMELLKNTAAPTVQLPLDPAPMPSVNRPAAPPASNPAIDQLLKVAAQSSGIDLSDLTTAMNTLTMLAHNGSAEVVVGRRKSKRSDQKANVKPPSKEIINMAHALLRNATYRLFGVEQAIDFILHESASEAAVAAFANDEIVMPETLAQWDFNAGYTESAWNEVQMERVVNAAIKADEEGLGLVRQGLLEREYLEIVLVEQLERIRLDWHKFQPKYIPDQKRMETKVEAIARAKFTILERRQKSRNINAQHRKYHSRQSTLEATIHVKHTDGSADLPAWERMLKILQRLGPSGMSEEEECHIVVDGAKVKTYKIKLCAWREPSIANFMRIIDAQTRRFEEIQGGTRATARVPSQEVSKRDAPTGLPECLYNSRWLASKPAAYLKELKVSKEAFALFVTATERMAV
ncbi:hypothetical protein B0H15DRAFT_799753 [Mycena belliarum]|uniref:Uncharacterized protein n=1 Tax=Mycena belliarum TaxID=1033014 RepID=A0AAD6UB87_9AGAR|nr:hypothetical protein B0H15DRAFT_799753 [Mycena belliae]